MDTTSPQVALSHGSGGMPGYRFGEAVLFALEYGTSFDPNSASTFVGRSIGAQLLHVWREGELSIADGLAYSLGAKQARTAEVFQASVAKFLALRKMTPHEYLQGARALTYALMSNANERWAGLMQHPVFHDSGCDSLFSSHNLVRWLTDVLPSEHRGNNVLATAYVMGRGDEPPIRVVMCSGDTYMPELPGTKVIHVDPITAVMASVAMTAVWPSVLVQGMKLRDGVGPRLFSNRAANLDVAYLANDLRPDVILNIEPIAVDQRAGGISYPDGAKRWADMVKDAAIAREIFGVRTIPIAPPNMIYMQRELFPGHRALDNAHGRMIFAAEQGIRAVTEGPASAELREVFGPIDADRVWNAFHELIVAPLAALEAERAVPGTRRVLERIPHLRTPRRSGRGAPGGIEVEMPSLAGVGA